MLAFCLRIYLAGLLVCAAIHKINRPKEFADIIAGHELLPYWAVNLAAISLPWLELISGFFLATGIFVQSATLFVTLLLFLFTGALAVSLLTGASATCGCFSSVGDEVSWKTILRDIFWILLCFHILKYDKYPHLDKKLCSPSSAWIEADRQTIGFHLDAANRSNSQTSNLHYPPNLGLDVIMSSISPSGHQLGISSPATSLFKREQKFLSGVCLKSGQSVQL